MKPVRTADRNQSVSVHSLIQISLRLIVPHAIKWAAMATASDMKSEVVSQTEGAGDLDFYSDDNLFF